MIAPYIIQPSRITSHSDTITDNIFPNIVSSDIISGNLTATISDHLPQFLIAPHIFSNSHRAKHNISEHDWSNVDQEKFILDYLSTSWTTILKLQDNDVNISLQNFLNRMTNLLNTYAPYKKVNKYKIRFKAKPWITIALQKSIAIKNSYFKQYIDKKDPKLKSELHQKYKFYRNLISTLTKKSKQNYYTKYYEVNLKNLKNIWKGINNTNSIISLKKSSEGLPNLLHCNNENKK